MEAMSDVQCYLWHEMRGKQMVILKLCIVLIAVMYEVAASANCSNIEIVYRAYCSTVCGGSFC
jgi:hypothetical protein